MDKFGQLIAEISGHSLDPRTEQAAKLLTEDKLLQSTVYDRVRDEPWLVDLACQPELVQAAQTILAADPVLLRKIPFRIDVPLEVKELAVWHQDHYYVGGDIGTITAWVPMQQTKYINGCLSVMPGSHRLGPLDHDVTVLKKRQFPANIFAGPVRYIEMERGDVLFFHSCLLHSGNVNLSSLVRYSVNIRYAAVGTAIGASMGGGIPLSVK
jgi:ectoine hydroxylase-related dioxygenase (phytanoyl-CoA dioxygenase family)